VAGSHLRQEQGPAGRPRQGLRRGDATANRAAGAAAAAYRPAPACLRCRCCRARRPCPCPPSVTFTGTTFPRQPPSPVAPAAPSKSALGRPPTWSLWTSVIRTGVTGRHRTPRVPLATASALGQIPGREATWQTGMPRRRRARRMLCLLPASRRTSSHRTCRWCVQDSAQDIQICWRSCSSADH